MNSFTWQIASVAPPESIAIMVTTPLPPMKPRLRAMVWKNYGTSYTKRACTANRCVASVGRFATSTSVPIVASNIHARVAIRTLFPVVAVTKPIIQIIVCRCVLRPPILFATHITNRGVSAFGRCAHAGRHGRRTAHRQMPHAGCVWLRDDRESFGRRVFAYQSVGSSHVVYTAAQNRA